MIPSMTISFFFFNDTATTEIYTLSLHDALPIWDISAADAEVVDCSGTIVMPGFITTHHHQYETLQRSVIPDGLLAGAWPLETYGSVVQNIWTAGRIADPGNPNRIIWDLGRVPYDPEDLYISEVVAC